MCLRHRQSQMSDRSIKQSVEDATKNLDGIVEKKLSFHLSFHALEGCEVETGEAKNLQCNRVCNPEVATS
mgnify:FL=1